MEATNLTDKAFLMPNGIYQGDCIALMQDGLYAQSIDMIYADPPITHHIALYHYLRKV